MAELNPEQQVVPETVRPPQRGDAADYPEMDVRTALERLRAGQRVERVRISRLRLEGDFPKPIELSRVVLDRPQIRAATFHGPVVFSGCEVTGLTTEKGPAVFEQSWAFKNCTLRRLQIGKIEVRGTVSFDNSEIHGPFRIFDSRIGSVRMWDAKCRGWIELKRCDFSGTADFRSVHVEEGVVLSGSTFHGDALFRGMTCGKKLDLTDVRCEGLIDLSKAKLHDYAYLEQIECGPNVRWAFLNAVADRIRIRPEQLEGRLLSEREGRYGDALHEYGLLKASFQIQHRFDDEDWALHRFKISQRRAKPRSWARPWTKLAEGCEVAFLDWGCGYGTKPSRAVATAFTLMFVFAAIYALGVRQFEIDRPPLDDFPVDHWANRVLFGLLTTVAVFTSGFGGDQIHSAHGWILIPITIEAVLGTLLWGLFVVAFSRKVIR